MKNLLTMVAKYGPPPSTQEHYDIPFSDLQGMQTAYGPYPFQSPVTTISRIIISTITSPLLIIFSFIIGTVLYLITHKKIFVIIPLILSFFYLLRYLIETFFGFSLL